MNLEQETNAFNNPAMYERIIYLKFVERWNVEDIAYILNISAGHATAVIEHERITIKLLTGNKI